VTSLRIASRRLGTERPQIFRGRIGPGAAVPGFYWMPDNELQAVRT
jgi:hypothetical protein